MLHSKMFSKFSNIVMATRVITIATRWVTMVIRGQLIRYHGYPPRCYGNPSRCHANITKFTKHFTICNTGSDAMGPVLLNSCNRNSCEL